MIAELGSVEDPTDTRKGEWITDAQSLFKDPSYSQFTLVSYFNLHHDEASLTATGESAPRLQPPTHSPLLLLIRSTEEPASRHHSFYHRRRKQMHAQQSETEPL